MAWYDEAVFYHIYPLGMTGAPKQNTYGEPVHRLNALQQWLPHIKAIGCNAIYIGPLFESVGHGYETTDYRKTDSRLGTNEDLASFVAECHKQGIRVIFDGVFNHTGRDFFAFRDVRENRESSAYKDWYCNVNFWGNNSFGDGFSYDNWGGYDLLAKLNQRNPAVRDYICDVIRFWVSEFDVDGIRLDAADVMDFEYMQALRRTANEVKPDFWLMGEVIHGNYSRWANEGTLHSVTNYMLHKALYSAHNDRNYFELAHTVRYVSNMTGDRLKLYTFADNHDVERIYTKLQNKAHFEPVHVLLYTLPGIPSIYYGSEFGIEGRKERHSDDSLRPMLNYADYKDALSTNPCAKLIAALGRIRQNTPALCYGDYTELRLQNTNFAFSRTLDGKSVIVTVNNADSDSSMSLPCTDCSEYVGALTGERVCVNGGQIDVTVRANCGEIWLPAELADKSFAPIKSVEIKKSPCMKPEQIRPAAPAQPQTAEPCEEKPSSFTAPVQAAAQPDSSEQTKAAQIVQSTESAKAQQPDDLKTWEENVTAQTVTDVNKPYEEMSIEELQAAILEKMRRNGPVTDYMLGTVRENTHRGSLLNWVRSFNN